MLDEYEKATNIRPMMWIRYIDDVFFIWHHDEKSVKHFINFSDNFGTFGKMKSNIKFETNMSSEPVNFLDVQVSTNENIFIFKTDRLASIISKLKIMPSTPRYKKMT